MKIKKFLALILTFSIIFAMPIAALEKDLPSHVSENLYSSKIIYCDAEVTTSSGIIGTLTTGSAIVWKATDFTYGDTKESILSNANSVTWLIQGKSITGFTASGISKLESNKDLVLPSLTDKGEEIVKIEKNAFSKRNLTSVKLPQDVKNFIIGAGAFANNNIKQIDIPEGVIKIDTQAFLKNQLKEVSFPNTVFYIGNATFGTNLITNVEFTVNPTTPIQLDNMCFFGNKIQSVSLPFNTEKVTERAFMNNPGVESGIVYMYTPNINHFTNDKIFSIDKEGNPKSIYQKLVLNAAAKDVWTSSDFAYDGTTILGLSDTGKQKSRICKDLVIPDNNPNGENILKIGANAFAITEGVDFIRDEVVSPNGFNSVILPNKLVGIYNGAFRYNNFITVDFPETLTHIGLQAFNCNKLETVILPDSVTEIGEGSFSSNKLTKLKLSNSLKIIPNGAFSRNINLKTLDIPEGVEIIGPRAFQGVIITSLTIPSSVQRIEDGAFSYHRIISLNIPGNVKYIGDEAFMGNFKFITLKNLTIEEGVETIGKAAFKMGWLKSVHLPESLVKLDDEAFKDNTGFDGKNVVYLYSSNPEHMNSKNVNFPVSRYHKIVDSPELIDISIVNNNILTHIGGEVVAEIKGNLLTKDKTIVSVYDVSSSERKNIPVEVTGEGNNQTIKVILPENNSINTKSYVFKVSVDGDLTDAVKNEDSKLYVSVLPKGKNTSDTTLSHVAFFDKVKKYNSSNTITILPNQQDKNTQINIYGTNLNPAKTKIKLVDQNGMQWPIVERKNIGKDFPEIVEVKGNGVCQFIEILLPDNINQDMEFTYYISVDGKNFDMNKTAEVKLIKSRNNGKDAKVITVSSKYADESGNIILSKDIQYGYSWFNYSTEKKDIAGYSFIHLANNSDVETGVYGNTDKEVTYIYTKNSSGGSSSGGSSSVVVPSTQPNIPDTINPKVVSGHFKDAEKHWAKEAIEVVTKKGLFKGKSDSEFGTDDSMTRGMLITVIGRLADGKPSTVKNFEDVNNSQYYSDFVQWAYENKIANGTGDNKFNPEKEISREELAVIIMNYLKYANIKIGQNNQPISFSDDEQISVWAKDAVSTMQQLGIMSGNTGGSFNPKGKVTRSEVAVVIKNLIEVVEK